MTYFAYGSNMLTARIEKRIGKVVVLGIGSLLAHKFAFNKRSTDGSLKADAFYTGNNNDVVHGVLFEITEDQKTSLDKAEGMGKGYELKTVDVSQAGKILKAITYTATDIDWSEQNFPYEWYKELIVAGAELHGLPSSYIERIKLFKTKTDPDESRITKELSVISKK